MSKNKYVMYERDVSLSDELRILTDRDRLTVQQALNVPAVSACAEFISGTVAMLPINLYRRTENGIEQIEDERCKLLNQSSNDTLDVYQQRKQFVLDYMLKGAGYLYIERVGNTVRSLRYVDADSVVPTVSPDAIFRDVNLYVSGRRYFDFDFVHIARNAPDGFRGVSVIEDGSEIIKAAYNSIKMESKTAKAGGNRRGILMSDRKLGDGVLPTIKAAWHRMWNSDTDNTVVLENGIKFQETSSTFNDMQLADLKRENSKEICKLFCVMPTVISGEANADSYTASVRTAIMPIVKAIEASLNANLLLESEKDSCYFEIETAELLKGDVLKLYQAYQIALKNNWMTADEIRERENLPEMGLDFLTFGLQDVLYFPKTGEIYTPNTNARVRIGTGGVVQEGENMQNADSNSQ